MAWIDLSGYRIKSAMHEESHEGTVWITGDAWNRGRPLVIKLKGNRRRARVICRKIDPAFIAYYNAEMKTRYGKRRRQLDPDSQYLFISQHYRDRLGLPSTIETFEGVQAAGLTANHPRWWTRPGTRWLASLQHADPYVRIASWLATLSIVLSVLMIGPIFFEFPQVRWPWFG